MVTGLVLFCLAALVCNGAAKKDVPPEFEPRMGVRHQGHNMTWQEEWSYVTVRPKAHMFTWLQYTTHPDGYKNRPLVFWHQGGPGASATGYGNMQIVGPEDIYGNYNPHTWLQSVSIVYLDSPVGTGYSYVESLDALTTDIDEIALDLITFAKVFFTEHTDLQNSPLYIFGESYGGKVAVAFAQSLHKAINNGDVKCKLMGYGLGNTWVSPMDSVRTWGPFLHEMSVLDEVGRDAVMADADKVRAAIDAGKWVEATELWSQTQQTVMRYSNYVDFYNILHYTTFYPYGVSYKRNGKDVFSTRRHQLRGIAYDVMLAPFQSDNLYDYMNNECRHKLKIIPDSVIWSGQSGLVFDYQEGDFMKDSLTNIAETLNDTNLKVVIYQGQIDLICDTKGAMDYVQKLQWPGIQGFNKAKRRALTEPKDGQTDSYVKANGNFKFYWMLRAGHTVPEYMGAAALRMLNRVLTDKDRCFTWLYGCGCFWIW